jgi:hypothetical protein
LVEIDEEEQKRKDAEDKQKAYERQRKIQLGERDALMKRSREQGLNDDDYQYLMWLCSIHGYGRETKKDGGIQA